MVLVKGGNKGQRQALRVEDLGWCQALLYYMEKEEWNDCPTSPSTRLTGYVRVGTLLLLVVLIIATPIYIIMTIKTIKEHKVKLLSPPKCMNNPPWKWPWE